MDFGDGDFIGMTEGVDEHVVNRRVRVHRFIVKCLTRSGKYDAIDVKRHIRGACIDANTLRQTDVYTCEDEWEGLVHGIV